MARPIPAAAAELVRRSEGLRLVAYLCSAGHPTIGWGHAGPEVRLGQKIDPATADRLLEEDLRAAGAIVERYVRVPLNDNQFSALVSLAFNIPKALVPASSTLVRLLNAGDYAAVPGWIRKWNKETDPATKRKRVSAGLTTRREREAALWATPC